jgi:cytochrome P450
MPSGEVGYLVTRYEDARTVLADPAFSLAALWRPDGPRFAPGPRPSVGFSLAALDPPEHTRVRGLVSRAFTVRRVEALRPAIQRIADDLLDRIAREGPPADLVAGLCAPLSITVICQVLGIPPGAREDFRAWSDAITTVDPAAPQRWRNAWHELGGYLVRLIAAKRETPADDLLSMLIATLGKRSADFELATLAVQLLIAGNETTLNQLGAIIHVLLREPETYAALCAAPELIPSVIEELLRLHPPNDPLLRASIRDIRIGGTLVPAGSGVLVDPAAANRDPSVFADPDWLDLQRTAGAHLTFGYASHFCLGAALARAQMLIAVTGLVRRFPGLRAAVESAELKSRMSEQAECAQPVTW